MRDTPNNIDIITDPDKLIEIKRRIYNNVISTVCFINKSAPFFPRQRIKFLRKILYLFVLSCTTAQSIKILKHFFAFDFFH